MKVKTLFLCLLFISLFSIPAFSQSVVITPKKVTYKRPKPESEYKKTFEITYPKVKAATPALSKKIEDTISYQKNNNLNLKDELNEYQWLETAGYEVNYNKNGLLDIVLTTEGSAAYPSIFNKEIVVDLKSGNRLTAQNVFVKLPALAAAVGKMQLAEIKKAQADYKKDPESADFDGGEYFMSAKFTAKNLDEFKISDKGVTFTYDYGFPHVVLALQPDGEYFFSWAQVKPYIKADGLLARFVR